MENPVGLVWNRYMKWRNNPPKRQPDLNDESDWMTRSTTKPMAYEINSAVDQPGRGRR